MKIVGIGASAGGVEVLRQFLGHLPSDTGAAFVIIQHLSPDFKSVMKELLQKCTDMPVSELTDNILPEPNHIYLMPGNKNVILQFGMLTLEERRAKNQLNLPIDKFFHSLGSDLEENSIGVILSGSGTDGSRGARTIKEKAGVLLVQSPESAEFDGMPNALIQLDIADDILPPEELAVKLSEVIKLDRGGKKAIVEGENGLFHIQKEWFDKIIAHVSRKTDIVFSEYKTATLQRRTEKQMVINRCDDLKSYFELLQENEEKTETLARDFLISVTRFFRDAEFFKELEEQVIPAMFSRLRPDETCRVWVAACSTGEEAYGIGILISEYLRKNNLNREFKIFASDVNKKSIEIASRGMYFPNILADVPLQYMERYFKKEGECYEVRTFLREKMIFAVHNVIKDPPFIKMHLISCRNFLIYLKQETQTKVLKTFYFSLRENHHLTLGPSESLGELSQGFKNLNRPWNIFLKEEDVGKISRNNYKPLTDTWRGDVLKQFDRSASKKQKDSVAYGAAVTDPFSEYLVRKYSPQTIIVNKELDILYLNGNWEKILSLPKAVTKMNLERMLPQDSILLIYDGMRLALESEEVHVLKNIVFNKKGKLSQADLAFEKVKFSDSYQPRVSITVTSDATVHKHAGEKNINEVHLTEQSYGDNRTVRLEKELKKLKKQLGKVRNEADLTEEELNTNNQELLATNEELQSTNEELQSLNEELHIVNTELQLKNRQLQEANDDINNLLKITDIGTIFLDEKLHIRRFTAAITRQVDLIDSDINRPINAFANKLKNIALESLCREVMRTDTALEREADSRNGGRYLLRIYPYRSEVGKPRGVVITLIDISDISRSRRVSSEWGRIYRSVIAQTGLTALHLDSDGLINYANRHLDGYEIDEMLGRHLFEVIPGEAGRLIERMLEEAAESRDEKVIELEVVKKSVRQNFTFRILPIFEVSDAQMPEAYVVLAENKEERDEDIKWSATPAEQIKE